MMKLAVIAVFVYMFLYLVYIMYMNFEYAVY